MDDFSDLLAALTPKPKTCFEASLEATAQGVLGPTVNRFAKYENDPVGYAREVLREEPWSVQCEILNALQQPPYRVMVKSGNGPGKSWTASTAINHWYDTIVPSVAITTAPTDRDVKDVLWKTVRTQRSRAGLSNDFIGPSAPEMRNAPDHYAKGFTSRGGDSFKGRHDRRMLFVFDEAIGIARDIWIATDTMFHPDGGHSWLVLFNPTDPTSFAHAQEHEVDAHGNPKWNVFTLSCLDHPNVVEKREVIPGAVTYLKIAALVAEFCDPIHESDRTATDIEWEGRWYRPSPEFESNVLGRWPTQGSASVWSDALWESAAAPIPPSAPIQVPDGVLPEIGIDNAGPGKDMFDLHSRWGPWSIRHESYNGWMMPRKLGRIKELCAELVELVNRSRPSGGAHAVARQVRIKIDDANSGGDLVAMLRADGYNAVGIHPQRTEGVNLLKYPDMRSQLWFSTPKQAGMGLVKLGRLPKKDLALLKAQAMAPAWWLDQAGRRCVEPKEITMEKLGRSPDGMDSVNLAYLALESAVAKWIDVPRTETAAPLNREVGRQMMTDRIRERGHRSLFGRRG